MRPTKEVNIQSLDVKVTETNMILLEQGDDVIVLHPSQVDLVCESIRAVAETIGRNGRPVIA